MPMFPRACRNIRGYVPSLFAVLGAKLLDCSPERGFPATQDQASPNAAYELMQARKAPSQIEVHRF